MIGFLLSPLGKIAATALLLVALYGGFRLWLHNHDTAILSGYVLQSEKDASDAVIAKLKREILLGQQIRAQADKEAEQLDIDSQKRQAADEQAISKTGGGSVVTADDLRNVERVRKPQ
ncbi:MAG: hypothetical protein AAAB13_20500 [Pseudomonas sp.]